MSPSVLSRRLVLQCVCVLSRRFVLQCVCVLSRRFVLQCVCVLSRRFVLQCVCTVCVLSAGSCPAMILSALLYLRQFLIRFKLCDENLAVVLTLL